MLRFHQLVHQPRRGDEADAPLLPARRHAQPRQQMRLARPWLSQKNHRFGPLNVAPAASSCSAEGEIFGDCEKSKSSSVFRRGRRASRKRRSTVFRSRSSTSLASSASRYPRWVCRSCSASSAKRTHWAATAGKHSCLQCCCRAASSSATLIEPPPHPAIGHSPEPPPAAARSAPNRLTRPIPAEPAPHLPRSADNAPRRYLRSRSARPSPPPPATAHGRAFSPTADSDDGDG